MPQDVPAFRHGITFRGMTAGKTVSVPRTALRLECLKPFDFENDGIPNLGRIAVPGYSKIVCAGRCESRGAFAEHLHRKTRQRAQVLI